MPEPSNKQREFEIVSELMEGLELHPGWQIIRRRIQGELETQIATLKRRSLDAPSTEFCRGAIAELEMLLNLPNVICDEARRKL